MGFNQSFKGKFLSFLLLIVSIEALLGPVSTFLILPGVFNNRLEALEGPLVALCSSTARSVLSYGPVTYSIMCYKSRNPPTF